MFWPADYGPPARLPEFRAWLILEDNNLVHGSAYVGWPAGSAAV
jgi:hypothetical protein